MIYVKVDDSGLVELVHYMPFDERDGLGKTKEQLEEAGFFVETVPSPEIKSGKYPQLKGDKTSKTLTYEYIDSPLTHDEELEILKDKQNLMQSAIDDLIFGGAF